MSLLNDSCLKTMGNVFKKSAAIAFFLFIIFSKNSFATHIIGGEISYKCIFAATNLYEVSLKFFRDCTKSNNAEFDSVVYLTIRKGIGDAIAFNQSILLPPTDTLDNKTYNLCLFSPPNVCVEQATYTAQVSLPPIVGGYYMTFQRCCRNGSLGNITNPLGTGTTLYIEFPDPSDANCNSSPVFNLYPPTVICNNDTFQFDHSATDSDGDSLVYEICQPYNFDPGPFGPSPSEAAPRYPMPPTPYRYDYVGTKTGTYKSGYTYQQPLGAAANMQIDPNTGFLTLTPTDTGQFVVAICVSEYRNGILLSTNKRDFQFNVANCLSGVNSRFDFDIAYKPGTCDSPTVTFQDTSYYVAGSLKYPLDSLTYLWDFGDGTTDTVENPAHTYAKSGIYIVKLTVNPGLPCVDSIILPVVMDTSYKFNADFNFTKGCVSDNVLFSDSSVPPQDGNLVGWFWDFGDGEIDSSNSSSVQHKYPDIGPYNSILIVTSDTGCKRVDTIFKQIDLYPNPIVDITPLTKIITIGESVQLTSSGAQNYFWLPPTFLDKDSGTNVITTPTNNIDYIVIGKDANGCIDTSLSATIIVEQPVKIDVPTAFTPNGDGLNDEFKIYNLLDSTFSGVESVEFKIFNRWGEIIFQTDDPLQGWDGKNKKGKEMEVGVYVWVVNVKTKTGEEFKPIFGNVSLLR